MSGRCKHGLQADLFDQQREAKVRAHASIFWLDVSSIDAKPVP